LESELVAHLAVRLSGIVADSQGQPLNPNAFANMGLAVVSPHRAQNSTIRQMLEASGFGIAEKPMPLVDTVEKLQGQERDIIIVSYGVADEEYAQAEAQFLLSSNRFNVAVTRARHKAIVFCSDAVLETTPTDPNVLLDAMMLKEFRQYCNDGHAQLSWNSSEFGEVNLNIHWKGFDNCEK
jgi:superfamily I DNA and/or RNA helicase